MIADPTNRLEKLANRFDKIFGVEARGIQHVPESMRTGKPTVRDYVRMWSIWFSANCTAVQFTAGILGPVTYGLGFTDAMLLCTFGTIFGSVCSAYTSTFGALSGNRTLVVARFTMGYWPAKLAALFNIVINLGYGLIDCIVSGQLLSAVSGGTMSPIVGIVVTALITLGVSIFGTKVLHFYQGYAWIPQVAVLFILIGCASPKFDTVTPSQGTGATVAGDRISYFFLTASVPLGWASMSADYYVYFPKSSNRFIIALMTFLGLTLGKLMIEFLGIGLACGLDNNASWAAAFDVSMGALLAEAFLPLGSFGNFCCVILALGICANIAPSTYSTGLSFQLLARKAEKIPRLFWCTFAVIIYTVCAIAGYKYLLPIFSNFLTIIGYWIAIYVVITLQEHIIFRRKSGWKWDQWDNKKYLPLGIAAFSAFCIGWVGVVLGMDQTYFVGPIAKLVGENGADLGIPCGAFFTAVTFPLFRYLELRYIKR
ncbi:putative vitamin B6 transporter [Hypoxylon trugodes]|uniref:putative vitamin B6 transporter n=1 Tax=Hypoxylon trugodes TaxID=326681 RepID=UPI0021A04AAF|nr:putative vitamin B6 transporter [Hypoxylon trugodes]KAI1384264.1 putative vitamin B6 transporter [Hypoxylon trugodes]